MDILNIAGRVHSISSECVVTTADEILDDRTGEKQSDINISLQEILKFDGFTPENIQFDQSSPSEIDGIKFCNDNSVCCFVAYTVSGGTTTYYRTWNEMELYTKTEGQIVIPREDKLYLYDDSIYIVTSHIENNNVIYELKTVSVDLSQYSTTAQMNVAINSAISSTVYDTNLTVAELTTNPLSQSTITKLEALRNINPQNRILCIKTNVNGYVPIIMKHNGSSIQLWFYNERQHIYIEGDAQSNYTVTISDIASVAKLTQAEYTALSPKDPNTLYILTD